MVTGRVDRGHAKKGDPVSIVGLRETRDSVITGTEMFHKELDEVVAGDNAGICCAASSGKMWSVGRCWPSRARDAAQEVLGAGVRAEEGRGGRHKAFFSGYRPQFYIRTMDVTGNITLPEGVEMVMPGMMST